MNWYILCVHVLSLLFENGYYLEYVTKNWKENMIIDKTVVAKQLIKICLQQNILIKFGIENKWISALSFNSRQFYPDFSHQWCNGYLARLECGRSGFEPRLGQIKNYKISICCFSSKHSALRSKNKDCLALNQNNVSEWSNMSLHRLLFQQASPI